MSSRKEPPADFRGRQWVSLVLRDPTPEPVLFLDHTVVGVDAGDGHVALSFASLLHHGPSAHGWRTSSALVVGSCPQPGK